MAPPLVAVLLINSKLLEVNFKLLYNAPPFNAVLLINILSAKVSWFKVSLVNAIAPPLVVAVLFAKVLSTISK